MVEDTLMQYVYLCFEEAFMRSVYVLTRRKKSAVLIAKTLDPIHGKQKPVMGATITNIWSHFGGKRAFLDEMLLRRKEKKPLAEPEPEKKVVKSLLTKKEMRMLAELARHMCLTQAVIQLRGDIPGPPLTAGKVSTFLKEECGSLTGLIEQYGVKRDS